jgi:outer membrane protein
MRFAMSEKKRLSIAVWLWLVASALPAMAGAQPLSANEALNEAILRNPALRAAASEVNAAQAFTQSEAARHDAALTVAVGATHNKSPSLSPGSSSVSVGSSDVAETSATLQKTLETGTQLSASVGASVSRSSSPYVFSAQGDAAPVVLVTGPGYLLSAKLGVTQPLLRGAGSAVTLAPYRQALAQQTATERERQRTANALARDVLLAYWELWYASKALQVDRTAQQTASEQRDDALRRAQTGSLAFADVLTLETQLAATEETLLQSELERSGRQNELGRLLGRKRGASEIEVSEPEPPAAKDLPPELLTVVLENSPEVATSKANLAVAQVQQSTAADSYRPRLDLDAYLQSQGLGNRDVPSAFSQFAGLGVLSAHVGLTLELPLTGSRYRGEARRARASLEAAQENLEAARNQVVADMTTLVRKHELSRRRIEIATGGSRVAEQNLAAKRALFATGSATALEITQAQDSVQAANKRLARARVDVVAADLAIAYHLDALLKNAVASR